MSAQFGPFRPNHAPEDPFVVLPGHPAPRGYFQVPPVPLEEHSIEGPVPQAPGGPRGGPAQPARHLHHRANGLFPQGVGDRVQVPGPVAPGPLCPPSRPRLRLLRLLRRCRARPPRRWGCGHLRRFRRGSRAAGAGPCGASSCGRGTGWWGDPGGLGGDQYPHVGANVVDGLVVVVGVVRRHLLDTRGDAPPRLDVRLRGRPAPLPLSRALPYPPPRRPSSCRPSAPWADGPVHDNTTSA